MTTEAGKGHSSSIVIAWTIRGEVVTTEAGKRHSSSILFIICYNRLLVL